MDRSVWKRDKRLDLIPLDFPDAYHLYACGFIPLFYSLNAARQAGSNGLQFMSWQDMKAWTKLNGFKFRPEEIGLLKAMDVAYVVASNRTLHDRTKQQ